MKVPDARRFRAQFLKQKIKAEADKAGIEAVVGSLDSEGEGWVQCDEALAVLHRIRDLRVVTNREISKLLAVEKVKSSENYICIFGWESARRGVAASISGRRLLGLVENLNALREGMLALFFAGRDECLVFDDDGSIQLYHK